MEMATEPKTVTALHYWHLDLGQFLSAWEALLLLICDNDSINQFGNVLHVICLENMFSC